MPALRRTGSDRVDLLMLTHRTTIMQGVVKPWLIGIQMPRTSVRFGAVEMGTLGFGIECVPTLQYADGSNRNDRSCTLLIEKPKAKRLPQWRYRHPGRACAGGSFARALECACVAASWQ